MSVSVCVFVQTDPTPLTVLETLLDLWSTISIIIYAASTVLAISLITVIVVYAFHQKYVQHAPSTKLFKCMAHSMWTSFANCKVQLLSWYVVCLSSVIWVQWIYCRLLSCTVVTFPNQICLACRAKFSWERRQIFSVVAGQNLAMFESMFTYAYRKGKKMNNFSCSSFCFLGHIVLYQKFN